MQVDVSIRRKDVIGEILGMMISVILKNKFKSDKDVESDTGRWWRTPLIPALGRQRQVDLCEFEPSMVYKT